MAKNNKNDKYKRLINQISELSEEIDNPLSIMSTITALLHHKMKGFFWTGYYLLDKNEDLMVGPYQGPVACLKLDREKGVCRAGIKAKEAVIVPDVEKFPGHIACDSRSKSEIVVPLFDQKNKIKGVLDIDSEKLSFFDELDSKWLIEINKLVFK